LCCRHCKWVAHVNFSINGDDDDIVTFFKLTGWHFYLWRLTAVCLIFIKELLLLLLWAEHRTYGGVVYTVERPGTYMRESKQQPCRCYFQKHASWEPLYWLRRLRPCPPPSSKYCNVTMMNMHAYLVVQSVTQSRTHARGAVRSIASRLAIFLWDFCPSVHLPVALWY